MSIGTFMITRNEAPWIAAHILRVLPYVDEMVFLDGNSTDGTLEIVEAIRSYDENGHKIRLIKDRDPKDLQDDYVRIFNEALHTLTTDLAWFHHPDMYPVNPEEILKIKDSPAVALSTEMRSFGGEPGGQLYEIIGRGQEWKNIYRLRNPDLGAHYYGHYGHASEDVYFRAITGDSHVIHENMNLYPYQVVKSGIKVLHFSDVRPLQRRIDRMVKCLLNNDWPIERAKQRASDHPRVTFKSDPDNVFRFEPAEWPIEFIEARKKYAHLERELVKA